MVVLGVKSGQVRLGIEAPQAVAVHREEVYARIQEENRLAAKTHVVPIDALRRLIPIKTGWLREDTIVKCTATRFGSFEVRNESILTFSSGLLGFPEQQRYVILDHDTEAPFKWLQSVEEPAFGFCHPRSSTFHPDYQIDLPDRCLGRNSSAGEGEDLALAVILTIPSDDPGRITANLRGPLIISHKTKLGKQLVLSEDVPTRHPLFPVVGTLIILKQRRSLHSAECRV